MKRFASIIALLFASRRAATDVGAVCSVNADCTCVDNLCRDDQFVYEGMVCDFDERCYCDVSGDEQPSCAYARSPPDDPTASPSSPATTSAPSTKPSKSPSKAPSSSPSKAPSSSPSKAPSSGPSKAPSSSPSKTPSVAPSTSPSKKPSPSPTVGPSKDPSITPTTLGPTGRPSEGPSKAPSPSPSGTPSATPTNTPTKVPSGAPTIQSPTSLPPTTKPTNSPTGQPTQKPATGEPTVKPTSASTPPDSICDPPAECSSPERDCGWGIWNVWTCQCDCAPGFCLSSNQQCYDGCTTTTDFNPFGGCDPRCDCPWYPDSSGKTHCVSTVNFAGIYNIYRNAEQCCQAHFSYLNIDGCVQESEGSVSVAETKTIEREERPQYYYPDIYGRDNCIYHNGYYDWMMETYSDWYLFSSYDDCCSKWYPARTDCPDLSEPTERDVNEKPYPVKPYFYPHQTESNCRFGRNYPQWMAQEMYVQDHLYQTPKECCTVWYPESGSSCPLGPDDGVQEGRYWQSDVFFYPNWKEHSKGNWCNVGNDYPEWMADPVNVDSMLFDSALACCEAWFDDSVLECELNVTATVDGKPVDGKEEEPEEPQEWYPTLTWPYECVSDGTPPSWMTQAGFKNYYVFESKAACCKAHYCASAPTLFQ